MEGWIKLHRKMLDWGWYKKEATKSLFMHLLLNANHGPTVFEGKELIAGQLVVGLKALSKQTGLTIQQIRTAITHLKSTNEITNETTTKYSIITITNWHLYQVQQHSHQQTINKQLTTDKNVKNVKKKNIYDYEALYQMYPRKTGKKKGMAILERVTKNQEIYNQVRTAITNYSNIRQGEDPQYTKQFSSFMNVWEDYLETDINELPPEMGIEELLNETIN